MIDGNLMCSSLGTSVLNIVDVVHIDQLLKEEVAKVFSSSLSVACVVVSHLREFPEADRLASSCTLSASQTKLSFSAVARVLVELLLQKSVTTGLTLWFTYSRGISLVYLLSRLSVHAMLPGPSPAIMNMITAFISEANTAVDWKNKLVDDILKAATREYESIALAETSATLQNAQRSAFIANLRYSPDFERLKLLENAPEDSYQLIMDRSDSMIS